MTGYPWAPSVEVTSGKSAKSQAGADPLVHRMDLFSLPSSAQVPEVKITPVVWLQWPDAKRSTIPGKCVLTVTFPTYRNESIADPVLEEVAKRPQALTLLTTSALAPALAPGSQASAPDITGRHEAVNVSDAQGTVTVSRGIAGRWTASHCGSGS